MQLQDYACHRKFKLSFLKGRLFSPSKVHHFLFYKPADLFLKFRAVKPSDFGYCKDGVANDVSKIPQTWLEEECCVLGKPHPKKRQVGQPAKPFGLSNYQNIL